jgi:transcriptional regulator with XRE-family HTH domain
MANPNSKTLMGERIASARIAVGLSQLELAENMGVKLSSVENWESDITSPRSNLLSRMSGILHVSILWLLAGTENHDFQEPNLEETANLNRKIQHAESLIEELSKILEEMKGFSHQIQKDFDG